MNSNAEGVLIFFGVLGGVAVLIATCCVCCAGRRTRSDEYEHIRRWDAAKSKHCGSCSHQKHHGIRCPTKVNNPNYSTCTCEHSHHKGRQCGATIHYNEYRTEQKKVRVAKKRTHYRTETQRVPVVKTRLKQVDQGGWVQRPYGPGNGTHAVYEPRMVSVTETYTEYQNQQVNVPWEETYYVDEMQSVQVPVPKTRACTCMGNDCRCSSCVSKVPCGCSKCDCSICAAVSEKSDIIQKKTVVCGSIFCTLGFIGIIGTIFALAMGLNDQFGVSVANTFHKAKWIYNVKPIMNTAVIIGWVSWAACFVCIMIVLIVVTCGDEIFTTTPAPPRYNQTEEPQEEEEEAPNEFLI